jgi:4-hydroxy-2-oxoheptanedioate aldolase
MDPALHHAIQRIRVAADNAGKKCGIYCTSGEQAKFYADNGYHMISVATDFTALGDAMADALATARGESKKEKGGSY